MSITRTGLPILVELINLVNYVIISNELTLMVNSPTQIPDCDSHSLVLLDLFISSDASICSTMAFPPLGNSDHVVVSVSIDFPTNSQRDDTFHRIAYVLKWLSLHWKILIMLLSQFPLTFHQIHNGMPHCITPLLK